MTFKEVTDRMAMPLERIAEEIGRSYATVLAYRTGSREPPPEVMRELARLARERGGDLVRLAEELEK